jgi:hypothetical protein
MSAVDAGMRFTEERFVNGTAPETKVDQQLVGKYVVKRVIISLDVR